MSLDTLKDHEMPRYGYSTRQSGPPPRDHITEYRPAICRGNAMGNTNLWRFLCPAGGTQNCMKTGGKSPYFSPVGGANEAAHILSLMGGRAAIQGRKPNGQLGAIEYTILEQPRPPEPKPEKPERENPVLDNPEQDSPVLEEPEQENPAQLNTNRSSKEKTKKDLSSTEGSNPVQSIPPTPRARTGRDGTGCGSGIDGMAAGPCKFNVGGLRGAAEGGHQKLPIRLVWIADISRWPLSALT